MNNLDVDQRAILFAEYILNNHTTIRATAKAFDTPKSTVHSILTNKLPNIDYGLYLQVKELLRDNFEIKHIHGGESTRRKFLALKKYINNCDQYEYESLNN